jgi:enoyl-[acyl-carrier protein] reductase I
MTDLMKGKRGLVMGVANERSIAWGIAKALPPRGGAGLLLPGRGLRQAGGAAGGLVGSDALVDVDVMDDASMDACFASWARLGQPRFRGPRHRVFRQDPELTGRFINTSRENFRNSLTISCYSFIDVARAPSADAGGRHAADADLPGLEPGDAVLQRDGRGQGGAGIGALSRQRSRPRGHPRERDLARADEDAGRRRHRRRAQDLQDTEANAPLRANATLEAVGGTAVYLASDYGACTTGEIITVDGGYHVLGMPQPENLCLAWVMGNPVVFGG